MENDTKNWVNIPNCLTIFRLLLIPVFLIAYYQLPEKRYVSLIVFATASFTDMLDGYLARKWHQITSFGKLCDPLADKVMVLSLLFCMADGGYLAEEKYASLNWVILLVMLLKELLMMCGALFMLKSGVVVQANLFGKAATVLFVTGIILVFPWHSLEGMRTVGHYVIFAAVCMSLLAMVVYTFSSVKKLKTAKMN